VPKSTSKSRCIRAPEPVHEHSVSWLITSARLHLEQMQHHMHLVDRCRCWPLLHVTWSVCQLGTWVRCAKWMNRLWAHLGQIRVCCTGLTAPPLEGAFWGGTFASPLFICLAPHSGQVHSLPRGVTKHGDASLCQITCYKICPILQLIHPMRIHLFELSSTITQNYRPKCFLFC